MNYHKAMHFSIFNTVEEANGLFWFVPLGAKAVYAYDYIEQILSKKYDFSHCVDQFSGKYNLIGTEDFFYCIDRTRVEIIRINRKSGQTKVFVCEQENRKNWFSVLCEDNIYIFPLETGREIVRFSISDSSFYKIEWTKKEGVICNQCDMFGTSVYCLDKDNCLSIFDLNTGNIECRSIPCHLYSKVMAVYDNETILIMRDYSELGLYNYVQDKYNPLLSLGKSICCERIIRCEEMFFLISNMGILSFDGKELKKKYEKDMTDIAGSKILWANKCRGDYLLWPFMYNRMLVFSNDCNIVDDNLVIDKNNPIYLYEGQVSLCDFMRMV